MNEKQIRKTSISVINGPTNKDTGKNRTKKNKIFTSNLFFFDNWIILVIPIILDIFDYIVVYL